jgi:hypothetical protein
MIICDYRSNRNCNRFGRTTGSDMDRSNQTALDLLEQLRAEKDELEILIRGLEKRLGVVRQGPEAEPSQSPTPRVTVSLDNIPVGFFHNLSQASAAEKLLRMNEGHPLTTSEIMEAFRKSGMDVTGKNAVTILYNALSRSPKFERVAGKAWGLAEWYPPEKRKKKEAATEMSANEPTTVEL